MLIFEQRPEKAEVMSLTFIYTSVLDKGNRHSQKPPSYLS